MGEAILSAAQAQAFREQGFVTIERIAPAEEVLRLRAVFERMFSDGIGRREGAQYDMLSHDEDETAPAATLPTIINPMDHSGELRRLQYRDNALAVARQLLGPKAVPSFEQVILKPARHGSPTPWHQDEAYRYDANFEYNQVSIWMPLQEATPENGCMQYIPGSHRWEVLRHKSVKDDPRVHAIECAGDFDRSRAVACPLPAGGAVLHAGRTLHFAGPNQSNEPRYAYILSFEVPPKRREVPREFSWSRDRRPAHAERHQSWRRKGGFVIEAWRKVRRGIWRSPGQLVFEFQRACRALFARWG